MAQLGNLLVTGVSRFVNTIKGTIEKAEKLATARTIQTKLDSTSAASFDGSANVTPGVSGVLPVNHGGTGVNTLASGQALIGNGTGDVTTRPIRNNTAVDDIGWTSSTASTSLLTQNDIAYWNGRYNNNNSNLKYASVGEIKNAATHEVETTVANDAKLPTGAAVKTFVEGKGYTTNTGTVTKVSTGVGLTGGDVTTTGTIKAKLKSETASTLNSAAMGSTASRQYAVGVDKSGYLSTNVPWVDTHPFGTYDILASKTYTGIIAEGTTQALSNYYAIKILPDNYNNSWTLVYRVTATMAGISEDRGSGFQESYVYVNGMRDSFASYKVINNIRGLTYMPLYCHTLYRAKAAGITNGYGHIMGVGFRTSFQPTNSANARTITFEILQAKDCTVSFLDSMVLYEDAPGTGSTNYSGLTEFNGNAQGDHHSGDANTNTYDRTYMNSAVIKAKSAIFAGSIIVAGSDGLYFNLTSGQAFDVTYPILYSSAAIAANANSNNNVYTNVQFTVLTTPAITLTKADPIFIKGKISGAMFTPVSTAPLTQTIPTSDDGYEYIYLGQANGDSTAYLVPSHPMFAHRNGVWQQVTGNDVLTRKSYTGVIATDTTQALSNFYAIKVVPDNYYESYTLTYKLRCTMSGISEQEGSGFQEVVFRVEGMRDTYATYAVWNNIRRDPYRSIYYIAAYLATSTGVTNNYGHLFGVGLRNSYEPTTAAYKRNFTFEILEAKNCTVSFLDQMVTYANVPGTGSTNYSGLAEFYAYVQGIRRSGYGLDYSFVRSTTDIDYS